MGEINDFVSGAAAIAAQQMRWPEVFGDINDFVKGAVAMGYAVAGLFFLRFYFRTKDRLFVMFCVALWLLGTIRFCMVIWVDPMEHHFLYWLRFVAYLLILGAIVDKNLPRSTHRPESAPAP